MSKIDGVVQWIALVALILSVIGNFVIFGYFDSERNKRIELETVNKELRIDIVDMAEILDTLAAHSGFSGRLTRLVKLRYGISVDSSEVTE